MCSSLVPASAQYCPFCGTSLAAITGSGAMLGVLPVGSQLANNNYAVGKVLGRGGFGITYLGADNRLGRQIALKEFFPSGAVRQGTTVVPPSTLAAPDYQAATQRFLQEAQVLAKFHHPNIVGVHDVFAANGTAYMVMEYLSGETFGQTLERTGKPLQEVEIIALATPLVDALERIHAGDVLHRDIKPDNIIVVNGASVRRPVLIDFGAARDFVRGTTIRQSVVLTPGYAPLEQYGERAQRGPYTDIYAFAATLYHLATGVQPPAAIDRAVGIDLKPPRELNRSLSFAFNRAIIHAMEMQVTQRPQTARAFLKELTSISIVPGFDNKAASASPRTSPPAIALPSAQPRPPSQTRPPVQSQPAQSVHLTRIQQIARELLTGGSVQFDRLTCPVCREAAMVEPAKDVGPLRCPVCRTDTIKTRMAWTERDHCPVCSIGHLTFVPSPGLLRCPACRVGNVETYTKRRKLWVIPVTWAKCDACQADFDYDKGADTLTLMDLPNGPGYLAADEQSQTKPRTAWIELSQRTNEGMYKCHNPGCAAEIDKHVANTYEVSVVRGRAEYVPAEYRQQKYGELTWAKIAHKVAPTDGTHVCPACEAQFDEDAVDTLTLRRAARDPFGVLRLYGHASRRLVFWRALAGGMRQPEKPGCICPSCTAQMQEAGKDMDQLIAYNRSVDPFGIGSKYVQQTLPRYEWQRIAAGKVTMAREKELRDEARREIWATVLAGRYSDPASERSYPITRPPNEKVIVAAPTRQFKENKDGVYEFDKGQLWITSTKIFFQGGRGNVNIPLDKVNECSARSGWNQPELIAVRREDRVKPLLFASDVNLNVTIEGITVDLPFKVQNFVELVNKLRKIP